MNKTILNEIVKMRGLMSAKSGQLISEQSYENLLGQQILKATQSAGTSEKELLTALQSFKDSSAFWNTNSWLKANGNKMDFFQIVNDEMEPDNTEEVKAISDALKKLGIVTSYETTPDGRYKQKSFKHTGNETVGQAVAQGAKQAVQQQKQTAAKTAATPQNQNVAPRFQKSVKELLPNSSGKMDAQSFQQILDALEGQTTTPEPTGTSPDLAQLQSMLNQLG